MEETKFGQKEDKTDARLWIEIHNELQNANQLIPNKQFGVDLSPILDWMFQITESKNLATVEIFLQKPLKDFCPLFMAVSKVFDIILVAVADADKIVHVAFGLLRAPPKTSNSDD